MSATATDYEPAPGGATVTTLVQQQPGESYQSVNTVYQTTGEIRLDLQKQTAADLAASGYEPSAFGEGLAEWVTNPIGFVEDGLGVVKDVATEGLVAIDSTAKLLSALALLGIVGLAGFVLWKVQKVV